MMKKIGILGAGQLGCMLAESIFQLGGQVHFYDPNPLSPGFKRTPNFTCAAWENLNALTHFFSDCNVVTYEFENVKTDLLFELIEQTKTPLYPSPDILKITQNRFLEKEFLHTHQFPVVQYEQFLSYDEFIKKITRWKFPFVIKTTCGGYDAKGQWKIFDDKSLNQCSLQLQKTNAFPVIAEEYIDLQHEASVIVARDFNHNVSTFPVFENIHKEHILHTTFVPAKISQDICEKLVSIAKNAAQKLDVIGILTTEFFIDRNNQIFVNEFAPRPHNSGHVSRRACNVSQFDLHARILLNLPLIPVSLLSTKTYFMRNIMGEHYNKNNLPQQQKTLFSEDFHTELESHSKNMLEFYLYGKDAARPKRKMGHFIAHLNS